MAASEHPSKLRISYLALRELGLKRLAWYAQYRVGMISGFFRWRERRFESARNGNSTLSEVRILPEPTAMELKALLQADGERILITAAEEVLTGWHPLFGAGSWKIELKPASPSLHWTRIPEANQALADQDIKFTWEPARFGWATVLARAYTVSRDERFSQFFWQRFIEFLDANPAYLGENWLSAQEAALRVIAWAFCWQAFSASPYSTADRLNRLASAIGEHAIRISLTTIYARAQNNNHLLSEAAGLYTAAAILPAHPFASSWRADGWKLFHQGLCSQINEQGEYIQQSANYSRLMIQLALWMHCLAESQGDRFPDASCRRLALTVSWLMDLVDPGSGKVPNLGPNDGAYILPLTVLPYSDYRPVLQAAARIFLGQPAWEPGLWDEMGLWLGTRPFPPEIPGGSPGKPRLDNPDKEGFRPVVLRSHGGETWAYLRAARFTARPGHADQLHVDLWWRGLNLALDPGTYRYTAPPPWDNRLVGCDVHNTVTVAEHDQMLRAGRFLYLDWAQACLISLEKGEDGHIVRAAAEHTGYQRLGAVHRRILSETDSGGWLIEDEIVSFPDRQSETKIQTCSLTWLLPDGSWEVFEQSGVESVRLNTPEGPVFLRLSVGGRLAGETAEPELLIARAGRLIYGAGEVLPHWGWYSPTYAIKIPALLVRFTQTGRLPVTFRSEWILN